MCKPSKKLRLCTCGTVKVSDFEGITWELRKFDNGLNICGESQSNYGGNSYDKLLHFFLRELNGSHVFDFDYEPKKGDHLTIRHPGERNFDFRFNGSVWEKYEGLLL